jgi:uncharacterized protein
VQGDAGLLLLWQPEFRMALMASSRILDLPENRHKMSRDLRLARQARGSTLPVARSRRQLFPKRARSMIAGAGKTDLHQCLPFDSIVLARHNESGFTRLGASALSLQLHRSRRYPWRFESGGVAPFVLVKAETAMAESHGRFVWYELTTTDTAATRAFYTEVVGWGARNASMAGLPYTVFTAWDDPVSGMMELPKAARNRGERPMWIGYVYVDDVDAVADRVKRLGGAVHLPPQDVMHISRFSVVSDPQMAIFALFKWQSAGQARSVNRLSLGCVGWHELLAADYEKAWDFYSELFGWQKARTNVSSVGPYQQFSIAGETIGGMMTKPPTVPTSCWLYYFNVGDIDAAIKRVTAAGGQLLGGPMEVPDANWIAQCADPQGAIFALAGRRGFGYFKRAGASSESLLRRIRSAMHSDALRANDGETSES